MVLTHIKEEILLIPVEKEEKTFIYWLRDLLREVSWRR